MKSMMKRTLSCLLLVCMLLAILPVGAFAAEESDKIVFDFTGIVTDEPMELGSYESVDINRNWICAMNSYGKLTAYPGYSGYDVVVKDTYYLHEYIFWFAVTLKDVPTGQYNMVFELDEASGEKCGVEVYIFTRTEIGTINSSGPAGKMQKNDPVGTLDTTKATQTISKAMFAGDADNEYFVAFHFVPTEKPGLEGLKDTSIRLKTLTLEKVQNVKPTTEPTIPDFNAPEEPTDDAGSFPIVPVVICAVALIAVAAVVVVVISKKKKNNAE